MDDVALLEFDPDGIAVLDPTEVMRGKNPTIPERVVMCFYSEILDSLPAHAEQVAELVAAHGRHPI